MRATTGVCGAGRDEAGERDRAIAAGSRNRVKPVRRRQPMLLHVRRPRLSQSKCDRVGKHLSHDDVARRRFTIARDIAEMVTEAAPFSCPLETVV